MKSIREFFEGKIRFKEILFLFVIFLAVIYGLQRNVSYQQREKIIEPYAVEAVSPNATKQPAECLILWEADELGQMGLELMEQVLGQMKIPYAVAEGKKGEYQNLWEYQTIVLSMTHMNLLDEALLDLMKWVREGGNLMVLYPPALNGSFRLLADDLGVQSIGNSMEYVDQIVFEDSFMLTGGIERMKIPSPYESALQVHLLPESKVHLKSGADSAMPLIWSYENEMGTVVFCNLGHLDKAYRGFYSASYSLLGDFCLWPVINGAAFYIDDFPAPIPAGENESIRRDYGMSMADFYKQVWWNDIYNLAEKRNIHYTGLAIEQYSNQVEAPFERNERVRDYEYYGNMLLAQGGEIGFHGYNHMPLCLSYQGRRNPSLKNWESYEDMKKGMEELKAFCIQLFPKEQFRVYSPPANMLSEEGREMLRKEFPDILAVASVYLSGDQAYQQEFEVAEDGMIHTPRVLSGYDFSEEEQVAAVSEMNFHYVSSHFQHFSDALGEEETSGWQQKLTQLTGYIDWLYEAAPDLRNLTGTEMAGAVQRYYDVEIIREKTQREIREK